MVAMDTVFAALKEHELPSANLGLPSHLIQRHWPQPTYVTHTAPVVKMLVEQDEWRRDLYIRSGETDSGEEPQETGSEEETQVPSKPRRDFLKCSLLRQRGQFELQFVNEHFDSN
ncbi:PREDICTED: CMT1A duplicated region transcript 4 protein [Nestor notabilis]|uniref:CMT1A duplicated region transcript 4 protein n=1 Tax=Nestor notabilis TaxID=176057 RepID=UPI0005237EBC|nr:PREDICTED: CMT1A duplicated region transcript 4 protein [Nestor notabilis]